VGAKPAADGRWRARWAATSRASRRRCAASPISRAGYRLAYGAAPPADDEAVAVDVAKALAAFQETIETGRTPFDDFRDAWRAATSSAAARYPVAAQRGLAIFIGKGQCDVCHVGPAFSNGEFHDIGIRFFAGPIAWIPAATTASAG
jgi:cytochrome c peroxidase